jgi:phosphatidate cytidylyltransferase
MIARVLLICLAAFLIGATGLYAASRKQGRAVRHSRLIKFISYFCIVNLVVLGALAGHWILSGMMAAIALLGAHELYRALPRASGDRLSVALGMAAAYSLIAAGAVFFVWLSPVKETVFVYLIVCAFDGFSQVTGQSFGRHQLAPAISPGKTIEGSAGGLLFAVGMALLLRPVVGWSAPKAVIACCYIAAAALAGDLLASHVKRKAGIKDYSNLLPSHGGILDRFDSFLFAAAACLFANEVARLCGLGF